MKSMNARVRDSEGSVFESSSRGDEIVLLEAVIRDFVNYHGIFGVELTHELSPQCVACGQKVR